MPSTEFPLIFTTLKEILKQFEESLIVISDTPDNFYLDTAHIMKNKKPLFFGAVQIRKNYVSFHLMPVYVNPNLLAGSSQQLKQRMQGKSCFNFKHLDETLFAELKTLTNAGFDDYRKSDYIHPR